MENKKPTSYHPEIEKLVALNKEANSKIEYLAFDTRTQLEVEVDSIFDIRGYEYDSNTMRMKRETSFSTKGGLELFAEITHPHIALAEVIENGSNRVLLRLTEKGCLYFNGEVL